MALAQLQKEMNAEMQKQRELINRELEDELKEELEVVRSESLTPQIHLTFTFDLNVIRRFTKKTSFRNSPQSVKCQKMKSTNSSMK